MEENKKEKVKKVKEKPVVVKKEKPKPEKKETKKVIKKPVSKTARKTKPEKKLPPVVELMVAIVKHGKGEEVTKVLNAYRIDLQIITQGAGTASSAMADLLGFSVTEKDVVLAVVPMNFSKDILAKIEEVLKFKEKATGIAFTVPLKSATSEMMRAIGYIM